MTTDMVMGFVAGFAFGYIAACGVMALLMATRLTRH